MVLMFFVGTYVIAPNAARAQTVAPHGSLPVAVTGTFGPSSNTSGALLPSTGGSFAGTFYIQKFLPGTASATAVAVGTLIGTINGQAVALTGVTAPVAVDPTCPILTLNIGAIHLDLLGLVVDTSPINLTITAQQGPGNLLGNLLCAVANLLNNRPSLANLLNQILAALGL
jgi:hypothetical protein